MRNAETLVSEIISEIQPSTGMDVVTLPMSRLKKWLRLARKLEKETRQNTAIVLDDSGKEIGRQG